MGIGEIVHFEEFLLFPQCFEKTCTADTQKPGLVSERVKFNVRKGENILEKGENVGDIESFHSVRVLRVEKFLYRGIHGWMYDFICTRLCI